MKTFLIALLILLLGIGIGYFIHTPKESTKYITKTDTIKVQERISTGISTKYIYLKPDTVFRIDTVNLTKPEQDSLCAIPYQTFREDSLLKIWIYSDPCTKKNLDTIQIKGFNITRHDTVEINNTVSGSIKWYYLPVTAIIFYLIGHK